MSIVADLVRLLEAGKLEYYIILGQLLALLWVVKQWRSAEKDRVEDLKTMVGLATEVKNNVATLVELVKESSPRRSR